MVRIHSTAEVAATATIGEGTAIWNQAQVRNGARLGEQCIVGKNVYIDFDVKIGNRVKIQNNCSIYHGTTVEDGVFLGPHVVTTNDQYPRAINPDGTLKSDADWVVSPVTIGYGAAIGARSVILPGVRIGRFAMVGAGSVVTRNVPAYALVAGNPARLMGYVCACGHRLRRSGEGLRCEECGREYGDPPDGAGAE
jgi:acetyltransferase-like isoleucine patch superfamily enzyme